MAAGEPGEAHFGYLQARGVGLISEVLDVSASSTLIGFQHEISCESSHNSGKHSFLRVQNKYIWKEISCF